MTFEFITIESVFGSIALVTSIIGLLPQVVKTVQMRSARDVSMLMLMNYSVCSFAWIVYGYYAHSSFVLFSNILGLLSSAILIWLKINYDRQYA